MITGKCIEDSCIKFKFAYCFIANFLECAGEKFVKLVNIW